MVKAAIACITVFLLATTSVCYSQAGYVPGQPSIDCTKVHNTVAIILCNVRDAAQADWDLNSAWWARYFTLNDAQRQMLDRGQQAWRQSLDQLCALPRYQTSEDEAGRAMAETFGRIILGSGIRIPGPQPITQAHVNCVLKAYHARAAMLRSKLTGDALAESLLSPEQHAELQQALAEKGYLRPDQIGSGTHDGEFGPITRKAIKQFQQSLGASASGFLSGEQQSALLENPQEREAKAARAAADKKAREDALVAQAPAPRLSSLSDYAKPAGDDPCAPPNYGSSPKEAAAFIKNFAKLGHPESLLKRVCEAQHSLTKRIGLYNLGLSDQDIDPQNQAMEVWKALPEDPNLREVCADTLRWSTKITALKNEGATPTQMLHWAEQESERSAVDDPVMPLGTQLMLIEFIQQALFNVPTYEQIPGGFPQFAYRSCLKNHPIDDLDVLLVGEGRVGEGRNDKADVDNAPRKLADTAVPKMDAERKEACKKDFTRCSDNTDFMNNSDALIPAQVACKQAAETKSKFGDPKWPWLSFSNYSEGNEIKTGRLLIGENNAQFQNAFGAWEHVRVVCEYDLKAEQVISVDIIPKD
jgi:peptidoglycan hydrolase-like protein with peptidoglycan-binding domain/uncharacterized protein YecT (DUF1311 family)